MQPPLTTPPERPPAGVGAEVDLPVGGFEKLSTVDWPGQLAAVVFCQGCAWHCGYCHNPHLIPFARAADGPAWPKVLAWLGRRQGLLDAVVFSGGEPTWHAELGEAIRQTRALGFKIGLHTGGPSPERLERLLPLLDWVGFDFKAPFADYAKVTGRDDGVPARRSLEMIRAARIACEIRTTWHPALLPDADLQTMADSLADLGCTEWVIQRFRAEGCDDDALRRHPGGNVPPSVVRHARLRVSIR
ncbi:MAG: pyruvate formate lyase activating enzyme [Verrucomicrobiota bacterium]|nr:pyruvate formate lyase activating enzyme [Verrucomicrobiota bacterium]